MSRQINQPINQVKLTNVAVVRMNKNGKRFEVACYKNKVMDYRQGLETDLSEVLQTDYIFTNVSQGRFANHKDLKKVFATSDYEIIAKKILDKGILQVSDLERGEQIKDRTLQIAHLIVKNCVHPKSQRPYTVSQIQHALEQHAFPIQIHKPMKKQYLDGVKFLKQYIPLERAKMKLALYYPQTATQEVNECFQQHDIIRETMPQTDNTKDDDDKELVAIVLVDPSLYRVLDDLAKQIHGHVEIQRQVVTQEGDVDLGDEVERKQQQQQQQIDRQQEQQQQQQQQLSNNNSKESKDSDNDDSDDDDDIINSYNNKNKNKNNNQNRFAFDDDDNDDESDEEKAELAQQLAAIQLQKEEEEEDNFGGGGGGNRKNQKKNAKKKSKKEKRRQKELEQERQEQLQQEQERQQKRQQQQQQQQQEGNENNNPTIIIPNNTTNSNNNSNAKSCNTCGGLFASNAEYRAHFKSDWHRFNQKLKLKNMKPISLEEFQLCDASLL